MIRTKILNNIYNMCQDNDRKSHSIGCWCCSWGFWGVYVYVLLTATFRDIWQWVTTQSKINKKEKSKGTGSHIAFSIAVRQDTKSDASSVLHRPEMDTEWMYIREPIQTNSMVLKGLLPETQYQFVVRAVNVHGASPPSHINNPVRTLGKAPALTTEVPIPGETLEKAASRLAPR